VTAWLLVGAIVASTAGADVLQSLEMKRHPESRVRSTMWKLFRRPLLLLSIACMAVSFFSFMALLSVADLSFAVPATAASYVVETLLAKWILKERVDSRRWTGALLVACGVALLAV
jgi:drug/metabolite transporter (DMT)-like permease